MRRTFPASALLLVCAAAALRAAVPTFWQVSTEAELLRGEVENLTIDSYGRLTLGPGAAPIYDATAPFLWTVVRGGDGALYVGTGNDGLVYRIDQAGQGTVFFDADELEVHALAAAPSGGLYVATSPDGRIYHVEGPGRARVLFDPPERYIWSLAVDRSGVVFAGTGDKGVIYRISPDGAGSLFYDTRAAHVMALALDGEGRLLAGTESPGRVFRLDAGGRPFVLLESGYNEIHRIRVAADGTIYAAAVGARRGAAADSESRPAPEPAPQPAATVSTEVTVVAVGDAGGSGAASPATASRPAGPRAGALFRILSDGGSDLLWESRDDVPYDVAIEPAGSLIVGTGNGGKIYRLSGDPWQAALVARADAQQVTALLSDASGQIVFATSNPGKLFRLGSTRAERGTYISEVRDAQAVAAWGAISWQAMTPAGTSVQIATRSGNTRTPDETWSDWSPAYPDPNGSTIASPRARYLQWRAVLTGSRTDAPILTSVTAAYLPRNARPRVTSVTVHPPGVVFQRPFPTDPDIAGFDGDPPDRRAAQPPGSGAGAPTLGRRVYQKGFQTIAWRAEDDNRDELAYSVLYRLEAETEWKTLREDLTDAIVVWDTTSVPNGRYLVRIVASDARSNSPATTLTGSLDSTTFAIDNAPPVIAVTHIRRDGGRTTISFDVRDDHSTVQKAEFSLDGNRWQTLYPLDGIADSRFESYELTVEGNLAAGSVVIRATDSLNNVSSARGDVLAPAASSRR